MTLYAISQAPDLEQVENFLRTDQNYAAYALGDLDPRYIDDTLWVAASRSGEIEGLALLFDIGVPPVLFMMGDQPALNALLMHGIGPEKIFFSLPTDAEKSLRDLYRMDYFALMSRMRVASAIFTPLEKSDNAPPLIPLTSEKDANDIGKLLRIAAEADGRDPDDIAFAASMIKGGHYFGIREKETLIATAGTHIVAKTKSVAAIGNVVTHPDHRRKGLGTIVTEATTKSILDAGYRLVVLNVRQDNGPAIKIYKKLGYKKTNSFLEGTAYRR